MRRIFLASFVGFFLLSIASAAPSSPSQYAALRAAAEREYAEKSFARAHELYQQAATLDLAPDDRQWVAFRLADTTIRATRSDRDPQTRQAARDTILDLIEAREDAAAAEAVDAWIEEEAAVDELSAEMHEALGDSYLLHPYEQRAGEALAHYRAALEWWARSTDLERARARYLAIVWRIADNQYGIELPREILVDAVAIATTDEERARARFLLAERSVREGNPQSIDRGLELLEEVIAIGRATSVYDDALSLLASQLTQRGMHRVVGPAGETLHDHPRALALYRRLVAEFRRGETPFYDSAQQAIHEITAPALDVQVAGTFLPDSEQELILSWRNVKRVDLALIAVDLTRDVAWDGRGEWTKQIAIDGRDVVRRWTFDTKDAGDHQPGREAILLTPRLAPGAYVITAAGDSGVTDRNLLLVTDAHILTHAGRERVDAHVSNVETGKPLSGARVRFWRGGTPAAGTNETRADDQGLARLTPAERNGMMLVTAAAGDRQAFHHTYGYWHRARNADATWRIYAFTDRPAYRPGETVKWKILARVREGEQWITPDGESLAYEITGPRGKVAEGTATLTSFGSFWAELPLTGEMPLGAYRVSFLKSGTREHKGSAMLFRLEEYKLPEFRVRVATAEDITPRLGDTLEVTIDARYYFGGPVANAEVEVVVYEEPLYRHWQPYREHGWLYPPPRPSYQPGRVRETQRLRTDANGEATLRVDTPRDGSDTSYRIEARVVDASRREVYGSATVRVTRHRYSVFARPEHFVHRVNASVSIDFKAVDANENPVKTRGTVTVVRRTTVAPPEPVPVPRGRRTIPPSVMKDDEILRTQLETDAKGEATLSFTPRAAGHYVVRWTSEEGSRPADKVTAETAVFVSDRATTDIGYRTGGGLDVILDRDTVAPGGTATVMLVTPSPGRWVVVSIAGSDLLETRVVRMDGTVRLLEFPVEATHAPALFVTASSIFDREAAQDSEQIVVPPLPQLLDIEVTTDRGEYQPREGGRVTVTTRDASGRPVAAEVALSVSDEAVTAIQEDPAGDPRAFFFGDVRANPLQASYGLHVQRYLLIQKPSDDPPGAGGDERLEHEEARAQREMGRTAGGVGAAPPPPPAPVAPQSAITESITVTAASPAMFDAGGASEVIVRSDFRSTAFWQPDIVTGADGTATVELTWPDALTTWRATARAATRGAQFGMATATARTSMPLLVRLQAPRFFVAGDRVTVSAVMNNNTDESLTVTPSIESSGLRLESQGVASTVTIAPHGEARADWTVLAEAPPAPATGDQTGTLRDPLMAKLTVTARSDRFSDAMERELPVYEHGIEKLVARSGKLRGSEALVRLELPAERRATALTVSVTPSIAVTMLDALPYLVEFPYGCTEQTMSRFLPAAVVARTIERLGLGRARLAGKPLDAVTAAGITRLYDMQKDDGSWGWWKESGSDPFMTAYVVWGFAIARDAGLRIDAVRIDRAAAWLDASLVKHEKAVNDQAWMLHALSAWRKSASPTATRAFDNAWQKREALTPYGRALLALTAHRWGNVERAQILVKNLEDGVRIDRTPDQSVLLKGTTAEETMATAYWGAPGFWWRWYEGPVETTSFVLQALVRIDPKHRLVEPAMNWLVKNRRGSRWNNTRDTAIALLAMNDYLEASGEIGGDVSYEVAVNGRVIATKSVAARAALDGPGQIIVPADAITGATQEIRIRRTAGTAPLYFAAEARFVSLEEPVKAAGNELFVRRQYFRLVPRPTLLRGVEYERVALRDGEPVASGDRIEVAVTVETKNDYEYLLFEDLKPAGFEATALQSGGDLRARNLKTNAQAFVYQELRDRTVASFIGRLDQGLWELRYELRAETPGTFHALPLLGQAMYVPEIRANGDEVRVVVRE